MPRIEPTWSVFESAGREELFPGVGDRMDGPSPSVFACPCLATLPVTCSSDKAGMIMASTDETGWSGIESNISPHHRRRSRPTLKNDLQNYATGVDRSELFSRCRHGDGRQRGRPISIHSCQAALRPEGIVSAGCRTSEEHF